MQYYLKFISGEI